MVVEPVGRGALVSELTKPWLVGLGQLKMKGFVLLPFGQLAPGFA